MRTTRLAVFLISLALWAPEMVSAQASLIRQPAQEVIEALGRYLSRVGGRDLSRELAELGGESAVRQIAERAVREGGDDALEGMIRLTRSHGPDAIRAMENTPSIPIILRSLDELPAEMAGPAVRRLAAGPEGRALAEVVEQFGAGALRAELRHPGVGGELVRHLGDDGVGVAARLNTSQAIQVARHSEDIARLPAQQREGILRLLHDDAERVVAWMGQFARENPGKTVITAATTTVILANAERVLGGGEIVFDDDGNPHYVAKPGLLERLGGAAIAQTGVAIDQILAVILPILALGLVCWIALKLWYARRMEKLKYALAASEPHGPGHRRSNAPPAQPRVDQ